MKPSLTCASSEDAAAASACAETSADSASTARADAAAAAATCQSSQSLHVTCNLLKVGNAEKLWKFQLSLKKTNKAKMLANIPGRLSPLKVNCYQTAGR